MVRTREAYPVGITFYTTYRSYGSYGSEMNEEIYLAGERVPAGHYTQVGSGRELQFTHEDFLPASFDGRVACYQRISPWSDQEEPRTDTAREGMQ